MFFDLLFHRFSRIPFVCPLGPDTPWIWLEINNSLQDTLEKMSRLLDAYALTDMAESQGHDEVQEALLTQQQFHDGTLFTEEDLTLHFSPGRKTLILGEQSSPEMISDSDAENTILTKNMFTFRVCHLENVPFLVVSCFSILKRFMISMFNHPRTVRRMRHLNLMRQNLVIAKNLLWKALKNLKRSQGTLEKMIQLTRRDNGDNICEIGHANTSSSVETDLQYFLSLNATFSWPAMYHFLFSGMKPNQWRMSEWHPSGGSYVCAKPCHKIVHNLWVTSTTKYGNMSVYGLKFPIHQLFCYESVSTDVQLVFWHFIGVP